MLGITHGKYINLKFRMLSNLAMVSTCKDKIMRCLATINY